MASGKRKPSLAARANGPETETEKKAKAGATPNVPRERTLDVFDATALVGIKTLVRNAVIEETDKDGETTFEVPKLQEMLAAAAVSRCLMPIRLKGHEIKAMRKIMHLTMTELAKRLDERTAAETISRWESDEQALGGYAEKCLRLVICEGLSKEAPGVTYNGGMIANLRLIDPLRSKTDYEVPYVELALMKMRKRSGDVIDVWDARVAA